MNFVVTPAARRDILMQHRFYAEERDVPAVAERFLYAVQDTIEKVCRTPGMGTPKDLNTTNLSGLRSSRIKGFPEVRVYYILRDDLLRVVRVLHGKRDIDPAFEEDSPDD